ncbi:CNNM domain-containing protein, partial [Cribrihabitans sp. XS_ASV171]
MIDGAFWLTTGAILLLLVLSGFFSGSETALTASSRAKLRARADKGSNGAQKALDITEDNERLIGSVLLGNNLVNILAASLATALFTRIFGESGVALATLVMTLLVLIFAEVLPKTYAITNAEKAASAVAPIIGVVVTVFAPVVSAVRLLVRGVLRLFGVRIDPDSHVLAVRE